MRVCVCFQCIEHRGFQCLIWVQTHKLDDSVVERVGVCVCVRVIVHVMNDLSTSTGLYDMIMI